jgi:SAM-dependent methyltransferase
MDQRTYFEYLLRRSALGLIYRKYVLYPRLSRHLSGVVLDVGCGIGDFVAHRPGTVGVDPNPHCVEFCCRRSLEVRSMQDGKIPYPDCSFDGAVLDNVLEHLVNPADTLAELHRVLRDDARIVVGVPGRKGYAADPDHKIFYEERSLASLLEGAGFHVTKVIHMPLPIPALGRVLRQHCVYAIAAKLGD